MPHAPLGPASEVTPRPWRTARDWAVIAVAVVAAAISGAATKRSGFGPALVAVSAMDHRAVETASAAPVVTPVEHPIPIIAATIEAEPEPVLSATPVPKLPDGVVGVFAPEPGHARYFNGRPVRPARTIIMTVTGYSPDARSCGKWADGITASLKSVWTNGMRSVAADTRILPFGSLVSVPGYADGDVVPVLDRGGAIKGHRLDLLYATHEIALQWGVKKIPVTIWEYSDES
jgi:3D (Asp-Asp-Asp) domain-containing protein